MKIQIINGPNLNLLGVREPGIYGSDSFESYLPKLREKYPHVEIAYFQSNCEGALIDKMQEVGFSLWWKCISPMSIKGRSSVTILSYPRPARE